MCVTFQLSPIDWFLAVFVLLDCVWVGSTFGTHLHTGK